MNTTSDYQEAVLRFRNLSKSEKQRFIEEELFDVYREGAILTLEESQTDKRFAKGRFCPYCKQKHVVRNGTRPDGTQKYKCEDCGKFFSISSNTILSGTHKGYDVWKRYVRCMVRGSSLRDAGTYCNIHPNTAFKWRHKILDALCTNMGDKVVLDGIVEADETFVSVSYKGSRNLARPAHRRGKSIHTRGLSREKVCVYTGVNRNGGSIAKSGNLGTANKKKLHEIFDGRIEPGSYLCTDGLRSYSDLAKTNQLIHVPIKGGRTSKGIYHIQNLNQYHKQLKHFLDGFNGVSTKYLDHYLAWHNLINYTGSPDEQKEYTLTNFLLTTTKEIRYKDIAARSPLPG